MKSQIEELEYETPLVKMVEVEVEQGFAVSEDGSGYGNDYSGGWG